MAQQLTDIKVPAVAGGSISVAEVLVRRCEWVENGKVAVRLIAGANRLDVTLPDTGVVINVLVKQGDSVSQGTVLIQLKKVDGRRPDFQTAWDLFLHVNVSVPEVGRKIGGKVNFNINEVQGRGKWTNACAVRMSYVLNRTGFPVQRGRFLTVSGADGMWYMPRVDDIIPYLEGVFGDPDIEVGHAKHAPAPDDFEGMKGILAVTVDGWGDATGHVTLWNGSMCSDACYLAENPHNRPYTPRKARLWVLP